MIRLTEPLKQKYSRSKWHLIFKGMNKYKGSCRSSIIHVVGSFIRVLVGLMEVDKVDDGSDMEYE